MSIKSKAYNMLPGVKIIGMHHLAEAPDELSDCVISPRNFFSFLEGKQIAPLLEAVNNPMNHNGQYALTVDDGLYDLYDIYTIATQKKIPITAFISTTLLDKKGYITRTQLREMADNPLVVIGSHGRTHKKLTVLSEEMAEEEIFRSKTELEEVLCKEINLFAYPNGACGKREMEMAKKAGYCLAFGVTPRKHTIISKVFYPYCIPRYNLTDKTFNVLG